jgi:hypothetical protein
MPIQLDDRYCPRIYATFKIDVYMIVVPSYKHLVTYYATYMLGSPHVWFLNLQSAFLWPTLDL